MSNSSPLVLVADDEPQMLELVSRHLKTLDNPKLDVIEASDGEQAWRLAQERLPDLVVLDVMMPGMSGWEVCRKIRENVALAHTGVVMLTGIGENLNQMTSPLYGADAYIDKPFEFGDLDRKVRDTLESRASLRLGVAARPKMNGVGGAAKPKPAKAEARPSVKKAGPSKTAAAAKKAASTKKAAPAKKAASTKKAAPAKKPSSAAKKRALEARPAKKKLVARAKLAAKKAPAKKAKKR